MAWPLGRCRPPTLPAMGKNRQKLGIYCLLTPLRQLSQDGATMNESEKQFSFTRAALSTDLAENLLFADKKQPNLAR